MFQLWVGVLHICFELSGVEIKAMEFYIITIIITSSIIQKHFLSSFFAELCVHCTLQI